MLEDDYIDTHLCIKCNAKIIGIENYIQHRKINCNLKSTNLQNQRHKFHESYEAFDFSETQHNSFTKQYDENDKTSKSISETYDLPYELCADVFFHSLELQSSSKRSHPSVSTTPKSLTNHGGKNHGLSGGKVNNRKSMGTPTLNNSDEWIHNSNNSENLMKAVRDISGTKKCDSVYKIPFQNDSPEPSDDDDHVDDEDDLEEEDDIELDEDEDYLTHGGGKWKPESNLQNCSAWEHNNHQWSSIKELDDFDFYSMNPPPSHTKGKWVPGTKIVRLNYKEDDVEFEKIYTDQYWCNICNRKLATKLLYERHLKSNLHYKRSKPEQELEKATIQTMSERLKKPSIYLNSSIYSTDDCESINSKICKPQNSLKNSRRKRRKHFIKCDLCNIRLPKYLLGKHLISYYHYRRMISDPGKTLDMILENIHRIILQSPFQCQPCRFYCNTEDCFIFHWNSTSHLDLTEGPGRLWCSFCKFECEDNNQMRRHLLSLEHQEVISAINRSVPIVIRKRVIIECLNCRQNFRYNFELRKHAEICSTEYLGTASNEYQSKFKCTICGNILKSELALQKHEKLKHGRKFFFCSICKKRFKTAMDSIKHRRSLKHKIMVNKIKRKLNPSKKCQLCQMICLDLNSLKVHILKAHFEETSSCSYCGERFAIFQDLARHTRDRKCLDKINEDQLNDISSDNLQLISQSHESNNLIKNKDELMEIEGAVLQKCSDVKNAEVIDESKIDAINLINSDLISAKSMSVGEPVKLICQLCNFETTSTAEFMFHELLHNIPRDVINTTKLKCPICNKLFRKHSLRMHLRIHTNERIFHCTQCNQSFVRKHNLKEHIEKLHHIENKTKSLKGESEISDSKFYCEMCDIKFDNAIFLNIHFEDNHKTDDGYFKCQSENCSFLTRNSNYFKRHQKNS